MKLPALCGDGVDLATPGGDPVSKGTTYTKGPLRMDLRQYTPDDSDVKTRKKCMPPDIIRVKLENKG